jgi:glycosyltransferase involved in cell wall biosynthesis
MKIGIDCRLAGREHAGIGRYIENLVTRLPLQAPDLNFVLFFYSQKQAQTVLPNYQKLHNVEIVLTPIKHYSFIEQFKLPDLFAKAKIDLLHVPHFNAPFFYDRPLVITIHDLLWHEQRGLNVTTLAWWKYWFKYLAYRQVVNHAISLAKAIFVPANTISRTVSKYYPASQNKIVVTKEGVDQELLKTEPKPIQKPKKYLLYVGSLYPHKNIEVVLQALSLLPEYRLKIVGARNIFQTRTQQQIKQWQVKERVDLLGFISDAELKKMYQETTALIQPSLSEGFGLTGVEAMACGAPVLASEIPIFQEIYGPAALYFNPHSAYSFVKALRKLETSNRQSIIKKGFKQAKQYSWDKMTSQTVATYRTILNK